MSKIDEGSGGGAGGAAPGPESDDAAVKSGRTKEKLNKMMGQFADFEGIMKEGTRVRLARHAAPS